jgi:hypothetical protein
MTCSSSSRSEFVLKLSKFSKKVHVFLQGFQTPTENLTVSTIITDLCPLDFLGIKNIVLRRNNFLTSTRFYVEIIIRVEWVGEDSYCLHSLL